MKENYGILRSRDFTTRFCFEFIYPFDLRKCDAAYNFALTDLKYPYKYVIALPIYLKLIEKWDDNSKLDYIMYLKIWNDGMVSNLNVMKILRQIKFLGKL